MAPGGNQRAEPAKRRPDGRQDSQTLGTQPRHVEAPAVLGGKVTDRLVEVGHTPGHDSGRQQRSAQAVKNSRVEERSPYEGVRAAHQLGDLDFLATLLDFE